MGKRFRDVIQDDEACLFSSEGEHREKHAGAVLAYAFTFDFEIMSRFTELVSERSRNY